MIKVVLLSILPILYEFGIIEKLVKILLDNVKLSICFISGQYGNYVKRKLLYGAVKHGHKVWLCHGKELGLKWL